MEAKDLMIGDFLRFKQDYPFKHLQSKIVKVYGIRGRVDVRTIDDSNYHESEHPDWLEPIPLTPEILEKNGFVKNRGITSWEFETKREDLIDIYGVNEYHLSINIEDTHGSGKGYRWMLNNLVIFYVHQLQHALKLCGIEKEIVL